MKKNNQVLGLFYMLLSSASFATMAAMIKGIGSDLPTVQLVFLRCLIATPFFLIILIKSNQRLIVQAKKVLVLRTLFGMSALFCFFYSLTHMPLADCVFIGRTQPLLIALFAPFIISEKAPRAAWVAISLGIVGVFIVIGPFEDSVSYAGLIALLAAGLSAYAHLMVRKLNSTDNPTVIVFNFIFLTGLITFIPSLLSFKQMLPIQWLLIAGIALFASLGQMFMTTAYGYDKAPAIAAASYSSILLSIIYGVIFWDEVPGGETLIGGLLIITGGMYLFKSRLNKK